MVLLSGCGKRSEPEKPRQQQAIAIEKTHDYKSGSMTVIQVPVQGQGSYTESQTCFVWKDEKTTALQCPNDRRTYNIEPD